MKYNNIWKPRIEGLQSYMDVYETRAPTVVPTDALVSLPTGTPVAVPKDALVAVPTDASVADPSRGFRRGASILWMALSMFVLQLHTVGVVC